MRPPWVRFWGDHFANLLGAQNKIGAGAMGRPITELVEEASVTVGSVKLTDLALYQRNARTHPQDQIEEIKASVRAFGFTNPILADLDDGGVIAAGHGRNMAVEQMLSTEEAVRLRNGKVLPAGDGPVIDCSA